ncbi:hypothetical protein [Croceibacterium mercuriale]|uniref:hypothetical protein n=1 Tax=Croceibacterium mercuriale TaxID=1572751 RepID=UPI000A504C0D|nr:hypothetical protein [Croceibacterium mercuriale]
MTARPTTWLFVAVAAAIAALGFAIGQIGEGAGFPVVLFLTFLWITFAHQRWGKTNG